MHRPQASITVTTCLSRTGQTRTSSCGAQPRLTLLMIATWSRTQSRPILVIYHRPRNSKFRKFPLQCKLQHLRDQGSILMRASRTDHRASALLGSMVNTRMISSLEMRRKRKPRLRRPLMTIWMKTLWATSSPVARKPDIKRSHLLHCSKSSTITARKQWKARLAVLQSDRIALGLVKEAQTLTSSASPINRNNIRKSRPCKIKTQ